ncbi:MAG TPA: hypothetical protein VK582_02375 [Pyrinomonadaceae bacterium]|nr:hypothetical protein [Pyrinomonadaceae bacterium]
MKLHLPKASMTKTTRWLLVLGGCLAIGIIIGLLLWILPFLPFFFPKPSETILETSEFQRGERKIVVTAYAEKNSFVPGAYYSFEAIDGSNHRVPIMTFRHDDPVPINKKGVVFLNGDIAYVFMGWMYAVTTDGGSSWQVWSADKDLPGWKCCNYDLIEDVHLASDGTGRMRLNPIPQRQGEVPELQTKDYGRHWSAN